MKMHWRRPIPEIRIRIAMAVASLLGYEPFPVHAQVVWAKNREDAERLQIGDSVRKFLPKWLGLLGGVGNW